MEVCWCGNDDLIPFSPDYGECRTCGTLVSHKGITAEQLLVSDDETDYYGKKYWLEHQQEDFGYDDIHNRARKDLTERNLHWLNVLLKYCLPPARVVELGCAHGSFVALLRHAGYDASGIELSPWVVEYGRKTFKVPISVGPIEKLELPERSVDAIVLMDVLEHLPDPVATISHCVKRLKPDGLLLIQTPQFKEGMKYAELVEGNSTFIEQLKAAEHLLLFSQRSVTLLFQQLGLEYIQFEKAIFDHYDMFLAVKKRPLQTNEPENIESTLSLSLSGRIVLALLDLYDRCKYFQKESEALGTHRDSAISQVNALTEWVHEARAETAMVREQKSAAERQVKLLTGCIDEARAETEQLRASAEEQIEKLTDWVQKARAETEQLRASAEEQIRKLTEWVHEARDETEHWREKSDRLIELYSNKWTQAALHLRNFFMNLKKKILGGSN
jgi:2-polyprenyl-3-methyl-5-hydroxy-6-metoxy-1,4-benzoquinol methylase